MIFATNMNVSIAKTFFQLQRLQRKLVSIFFKYNFKLFSINSFLELSKLLT